MSYNWQTQYARHQFKGEKNSGKHATVPNQALSIQQLLERYARGLPLEDVRTPIYEHHGEVEDEDFARMYLKWICSTGWKWLRQLNRITRTKSWKYSST